MISNKEDANAPAKAKPKTGRKTKSSLLAHGEGAIWLNGGALLFCLALILALFAWIAKEGMKTFVPREIVRFQSIEDPTKLIQGELTEVDESFRPTTGQFSYYSEESKKLAQAVLDDKSAFGKRWLVKTANFELTTEHYTWLNSFEYTEQEVRPEWALLIERLEWGPFVGTPQAFLSHDKEIVSGAAASFEAFEKHLPATLEMSKKLEHIRKHKIGEINDQSNEIRLLEKDPSVGDKYAAKKAELAQKREEHQREVDSLQEEVDRYALRMVTADGTVANIMLKDIVRAFPPNRLSAWEKTSIYLSRWFEFLTEAPRQSNGEGGVFPALFGTAIMTLLMCIMVVPIGVLAALYLREYAKQGWLTSLVRIAINNLAGVPSIVFGVFGLGFFCYIIGAEIDQLLYADYLPNPTYGKGGLLWAALTLALLTVPVVIVSTEEALAAVPRSMREGSYGCGASKWQTIRRIVLPRALPGILTGTILAIARGAGEVAPLMLVGAAKLAPEALIDSTAPFIHLQRSFMHLGYHIYDVGFQSQNSDAAKPMVYTTTLLLIALIFLLNITAVVVRTRLRKRFALDQF